MSTDYLVIGGSLAAQVLVSRLREYEPDVSIALIVPDANRLGTSSSRSSSQCSYKQEGRSGSTHSSSDDACPTSLVRRSMLPLTTSAQSINWRRNGADGYNKWAELVQDSRWSYDSLQVYFQRVDAEVTNGNGNNRKREQSPPGQMSDLVRQVLLAEMQSTGKGRDDAAAGLYREPYRDKALFPPTAYPLQGIELIRVPMKRLLFSRKIARGVELEDGRRIIARREVVIAAGAVETAHRLLLSGVGPADELTGLGIECLVNTPVGRNLHGQSAFVQRYEVSNRVSNAEPETASRYLLGSPLADMITASAQRDAVRHGSASEKSGYHSPHSIGGPICICPLSDFISAIRSPSEKKQSPKETETKRTLAIATVNASPHSRGAVSLASADPDAGAVVSYDPLENTTDRAIFQQGIRLATRMFETPLARQAFRPLPSEMPFPHSASTAAELDSYLDKSNNMVSISAGGTAAMGLVVDNNLKVMGAERLRVVDESVLPCPIAADYRAAACVIAEQAAVLITLSWNQTDDCAPV